MNTHKSSRKDQSTDDDLSCASTSSSSTFTIKASIEDYECKYCNLYAVICYETEKVNLQKYVHFVLLKKGRKGNRQY